jgi:LuxR family maltose regulon positive regulatory protein
VLRLLTTGGTNDEIARDLYVASGTVKAHVSNFMAKLRASNRTEDVARGRDLGLLSSKSEGPAPRTNDAPGSAQE